MLKYLLKRVLYGIGAICVVIAIVMIMIYSLLDRTRVFAQDAVYNKTASNQREVYRNTKWEEFGYLDFVPYTDYMQELVRQGEIDEDTRAAAASIGRTPEDDSPETAEFVKKFTEEYESQGYKVQRLDADVNKRGKLKNGGQQQLFAVKDRPLAQRLVEYFGSLLEIDSVHYVEEDIENRGLTFTLYDPVYEGKFSPAIIGNGTKHKYLLYCDSTFPYIHQNLATIRLGMSYSVSTGVDVFHSMTRTQRSYVMRPTTFPTGLQEDSADDLHTATYLAGSRTSSMIYEDRFTDDYTVVDTVRSGLSKIGYSFVIGIIATCLAYLLAVPIGILMAQKKDRLVDKLGTFYIVFISAVPSLAYIFMFKAIGAKLGMPITFDVESTSKLIYVLPIVSLALPQVAMLMKWLRRYMIDQMNSDYVKFARASGMTEGEIFRGHILKNAAIPLVHGIPGAILSALVGAIITERVYVVPGTGNLLTEAINKYDNGVIVGVTLFYSVLTVTSTILGDVLMAAMDPRISFTIKDR